MNTLDYQTEYGDIRLEKKGLPCSRVLLIQEAA